MPHRRESHMHDADRITNRPQKNEDPEHPDEVQRKRRAAEIGESAAPEWANLRRIGRTAQAAFGFNEQRTDAAKARRFRPGRAGFALRFVGTTRIAWTLTWARTAPTADL